MARFSTILYEIRDAIAIITLDRREKLNAFNLEMKDEICQALDAVDGDDAVRAVVITGAGRAFCAGADLSAGAATFDYAATPEWQQAGSFIKPDGTIDYDHPSARDSGGQVALRLFHCLKPVVAAINGPAVGIGATMLLAMDVRIAARDAAFGFVFTRRGVVPEAASSWFLPRIVGISTALEWCFSGEMIPASRALERGLLRSLHDPDELLDDAIALARSLTQNSSPVSTALARRMLWEMLGESGPAAAHDLDSRLMIDRGLSNDAKEGIASFLEKRPARFPDSVSSDMPPNTPR